MIGGPQGPPLGPPMGYYGVPPQMAMRPYPMIPIMGGGPGSLGS